MSVTKIRRRENWLKEEHTKGSIDSEQYNISTSIYYMRVNWFRWLG